MGYDPREGGPPKWIAEQVVPQLLDLENVPKKKKVKLIPRFYNQTTAMSKKDSKVKLSELSRISKMPLDQQVKKLCDQ